MSSLSWLCFWPNRFRSLWKPEIKRTLCLVKIHCLLCLLFFLFLFVLLWILYHFLCNDCAPKYRRFCNLGLTNNVENCATEKLPCLFCMICLLMQSNVAFAIFVTVSQCWIIFNFSSIISSLVNHRTFVFISFHSIDFCLFLFLLISNYILIYLPDLILVS